MALGADRTAIVSMVMREAAVLLGAGLAAGGVLSTIAARTARSLVFGVATNDPATIVAAMLLLAAAAAAASYVPARGAARVEPTAALREE